MKIMVKTVTVEVPLPFTDPVGEAFVAFLDGYLDTLLVKAAMGAVTAALLADVPLADVATVQVSD